ncbi:TspO family protein [Natronomonas moolapensis 8.8.11]|uniref:TspO family protein n=1 Tax=Natronomonas moolapensis (strain DSM 18674 / CECT 7526 / JCM 14361 / 8.8.11) TaxID=268739 RepID=M1XR23_NATM8|nr:TspO/MBR family protein [Natronomonas moolapensis]CCQ36649.1 TspO family protein [Natronomonas moolapensis 8.8.11]
MSPITAALSNRRATLFRTAGFVVGTNVLGALPAVLVGTDTRWFEEPWFYPPGIAFPVAWTALFILMGLSVSLVYGRGIDRPGVRVALAAFAVQFVFNLAWTPVFFGLQRPGLGLAVVVALWIAVFGTIAAVARVDRRAAVLLVPYLGWVSFATVLNYAIYAQ